MLGSGQAALLPATPTPCFTSSAKPKKPIRPNDVSTHKGTKCGEDLPSHDSVLLEGFDRTASLLNCFSYQLFSACFLQCTCENFGLGLGRNQQHSVDVAKNNISGTDAHISDLNRNAKIDNFVTRR